MNKLIFVWSTVALLAMLTSLTGCGSSEQFYSAPTCKVSAVSGGSLISCPDGSQQVVTNGSAGPQGLPGAIGANGSAGVNATPITVVQFCAGDVSYPSSFPESGLCINNQLYGVYSSLGGYWTYLPPGVYASNGVGVSCNFTITSGCNVSN